MSASIPQSQYRIAVLVIEVPNRSDIVQRSLSVQNPPRKAFTWLTNSSCGIRRCAAKRSASLSVGLFET